jgi:hypothetical protein
VWVWQGITVKNCGTGFVLTASGGTGAVGSVTFIDSIFTGISKSAIVLTTPTSTPNKGSTGVVLDNVALGGNIADQNGNQLKASGYVNNVSLDLHCCIKPLECPVLLTGCAAVGDWTNLRQEQQAHLDVG